MRGAMAKGKEDGELSKTKSTEGKRKLMRWKKFCKRRQYVGGGERNEVH
jgi:hypothetical protein